MATNNPSTRSPARPPQAEYSSRPIPHRTVTGSAPGNGGQSRLLGSAPQPIITPRKRPNGEIYDDERPPGLRNDADVAYLARAEALAARGLCEWKRTRTDEETPRTTSRRMLASELPGRSLHPASTSTMMSSMELSETRPPSMTSLHRRHAYPDDGRTEQHPSSRPRSSISESTAERYTGTSLGSLRSAYEERGMTIRRLEDQQRSLKERVELQQTEITKHEKAKLEQGRKIKELQCDISNLNHTMKGLRNQLRTLTTQLDEREEICKVGATILSERTVAIKQLESERIVLLDAIQERDETISVLDEHLIGISNTPGNEAVQIALEAQAQRFLTMVKSLKNDIAERDAKIKEIELLLHENGIMVNGSMTSVVEATDEDKGS